MFLELGNIHTEYGSHEARRDEDKGKLGQQLNLLCLLYSLCRLSKLCYAYE